MRARVAGLLWLCACSSGPSVPELASPASHARVVTRPFASPYSYEWFVRAELLRAGGQRAQALDAYRNALSGADEDPALLARYGSALTEAGEDSRAQEVLDQALALDAENEAVWLARASWLQRRGDLVGTYTALEHAEQAAPQSARASRQLAELLSAGGHTERARAVLERYGQRSLRGAADAYRAELDLALLSAQPEAVFAATLPYRLGSPPGAAAPLNHAAAVLLAAGRPARAQRVLELLADADRDARSELLVLLAVGSADALEAWLASHEPSDPDARLLMIRAELRLGRWRQAAARLEAERLLQSESPVLQLLAAELELGRGHASEAAEQFARIPSSTSVASEAKSGLVRALGALGLAAVGAELNQ